MKDRMPFSILGWVADWVIILGLTALFILSLLGGVRMMYGSEALANVLAFILPTVIVCNLIGMGTTAGGMMIRRYERWSLLRMVAAQKRAAQPGQPQRRPHRAPKAPGADPFHPGEPVVQP
jgi:hypothetical protein